MKMNKYQLKRIRGAKEILARHDMLTQNHRVKVLGKTFIIFPQVFSPKLSGSGHFIAKCLVDVAKGKNVLEIGTGSGVASVLAALNGANRVVATDSNPSAIQCAKQNIKLHRVDRIVEVRKGDLFGPIQKQERFDIILFPIPYIFIDDEFKPSHFERAVFDPGYNAQKEFLKKAGSYLSPEGYVMMPISDAGLIRKFKSNIKAANWQSTIIGRDNSANPMGIKFDRRMYKLTLKS